MESSEKLKEGWHYIDLIYKGFLKEYKKLNNPEAMQNMNKLCVRLLFCYYAEDSGIFEKKLFFSYIQRCSTENAHSAFALLFETLGTPIDKRDPNNDAMDAYLKRFPYVRGGLFNCEKDVQIPCFSEELLDVVKAASKNFDWDCVSPILFCSVFESTLNPITRRHGGIHYTSIENIHRVIDPLFVDDLCDELKIIRLEWNNASVFETKTKIQEKLLGYQKKLASFSFLDPACGGGNFLAEIYVTLRRLENEAMSLLLERQDVICTDMRFIKVSLDQFYGIEIHSFAVSVAKAALWIAEAQMHAQTESLVGQKLAFQPLKNLKNVVHGNALRMDWALIGNRGEGIDPASSCFIERNCKIDPNNAENNREFIKNTANCDTASSSQFPVRYYDYIIGNPPFVGGMKMSREQHQDMEFLFGNFKGLGELDYVSSWYYKAVELMKNAKTRAAFISTDSITQGQQASTLWKPLFERGAHIDFAYRTFRWNSTSDNKAHVLCAIIGFSCALNSKPKKIFNIKSGNKLDNIDSVVQYSIVNNINSYLLDADSIFVESRCTPLCNVPPMLFGSMPRDGGGFLLNEIEKEELIAEEPLSKKWIRPYLGAEEFIKGKKRYCLWLVDANPRELRQCPRVQARIEDVKRFRLSSKAEATRKYAKQPTLFCQNAQPTKGNYLLVPSVSSEKRYYVPMAFFDCSVVASNAVQMIPNAKVYHFGVLTSNVHMGWMRTVCGYLGTSYRYSKDIVYNNFPWPEVTKSAFDEITMTAQNIIKVRAHHEEASMAELYDDISMPADLRKAHEQNDHAVMKAYGFDPENREESKFVAELLDRYAKLVGHKI